MNELNKTEQNISKQDDTRTLVQHLKAKRALFSDACLILYCSYSMYDAEIMKILNKTKSELIELVKSLGE